MTRTRLGVALLLAALLVAGCSSGSSSQAAATTPSSATGSPSADLSGAGCTNPEGGPCLGALTAGTAYTTQVFTPPLTYQVPASGWRNFEDTPGNVLLVPPGNDLPGVNAGTSDFLGVYTSVTPSRFAQLDGCVTEPVPHVPATPAAMTAWLAGQSILQVSHPSPVSIGGLRGLRVDVRARPGASLPTCHAGGDDVTVALLFSGLAPSSLDHGVIHGMTMRLYLLRFHGGILAVELDDIDRAPGTLGDLSAVAEGLRFAG
jgi:hypothetical protein